VRAGGLARAITQARIDAYAAASGDHNPIHVDAAFAAASPFGGTIAHGMLVLAVAAEALHERYGDDWLTRGRLKVRFKAPTPAGETIAATIADAGEESAVIVTNERGETLLEGRAGLREFS
jgi:3-hydroxybutyryl-CoA dehydratase